MTQLIIDGREAVLPQNLSVTVKRENSFFTKSGEYTYDLTLQLDNETNLSLYGFLSRVNKTDLVETKRPATLIADGRVYCRGTEIITRWTDEAVTIQIVSGESEMNYFIGQDQKIEDLDLGSIAGNIKSGGGTYPSAGYCLATIRSSGGSILNNPNGGQRTGDDMVTADTRPQPYLCELLRRIIGALGYNQGRSMVNQLEDTQFKNLFIVNTVFTAEYAKMVPGWTVKEFLTEVEKLTGAVFVTDNLNKTCDILLKTQYYMEATQYTIHNVVDAYQTEVEDDDSREAEFTSSDVSYDLPDHHWTKLMKLPSDFLETATVSDYASVGDIISSAADPKVVKRDLSTGRLYIDVTREVSIINPEPQTETHRYLIEIDQFRDLDRENTSSTLELKITPAPMAQLGRFGMEVIDLGANDGYQNYEADSDAGETEDEGSEEVESLIRGFEKTETSAADLYCAFYNGVDYHTSRGTKRGIIVYTDAYHASIQGLLYPMSYSDGNTFLGLEGSLRLQDLDSGYYQGGYQIDTRHAMTFETYDPNMIDPRQVYVVRNKRFVVRDIEEVITAEGRQPKWKLTCYPIHVSDDALEKRWVLTHGVWEDGAAWLDDGRWNDNPI